MRWLYANWKFFITVAIAILFTSFIVDSEIKRFQLNGFAQGTTWQVTYYATDSLISQESIDDIFDEIDLSMSLYRSNSLINKFNASEKGIKADLYLKSVVQKSIEIYKISNGTFDITVKPLVQAWGFGVKNVSINPDKKSIKSILKCIGSDKIFLKNDSLLKSKSCVEIDLNGIAQGYTVDIIADFLETRNITNYLVEVGGEIKVKGKKSDGSNFNIGIETPDIISELPFRKIVSIKEGAITTSGNYRKFRLQGNKKLSHLINAKSGYPIDNEMISVTVWAKDAITADAYDNVLMNLGVNQSLKLLKNTADIEAYFIYLDKKGHVTDTATNGFSKFFKKETDLKK